MPCLVFLAPLNFAHLLLVFLYHLVLSLDQALPLVLRQTPGSVDDEERHDSAVAPEGPIEAEQVEEDRVEFDSSEHIDCGTGSADARCIGPDIDTIRNHCRDCVHYTSLPDLSRKGLSQSQLDDHHEADSPEGVDRDDTCERNPAVRSCQLSRPRLLGHEGVRPQSGLGQGDDRGTQEEERLPGRDPQHHRAEGGEDLLDPAHHDGGQGRVYAAPGLDEYVDHVGGDDVDTGPLSHHHLREREIQTEIPFTAYQGSDTEEWDQEGFAAQSLEDCQSFVFFLSLFVDYFLKLIIDVVV